MSTYSGKFSESKGNASCFDRDTSVCKPSRNAGTKPTGYPDYAGGRTARKPGIDPDLEYVNSGSDND